MSRAYRPNHAESRRGERTSRRATMTRGIFLTRSRLTEAEGPTPERPGSISFSLAVTHLLFYYYLPRTSWGGDTGRLHTPFPRNDTPRPSPTTLFLLLQSLVLPSFAVRIEKPSAKSMPPGQPYSFSNPRTAQMSSATSPFLDPPSSSAQQPYRDSFDTTASRPDPGVPGGRDLFFPNSSGGPPSMSREGSHDSVLSSSNGLVAGGVSASRGSRTSLTSAAYSDDVRHLHSHLAWRGHAPHYNTASQD